MHLDVPGHYPGRAVYDVGRNLAVAAEQVVKAWDMDACREELERLIDDLRQALCEFEGHLGDVGTDHVDVPGAEHTTTGRLMG